jgi:putative acetyltransferase
MIRRARTDDLNRIAEIEVFNYRLLFYPIFRSDEFYFGELQVPNVAKRYADSLEDIRVWDDGVVKGFILVKDGEVKKLFVEPVLQGQGLGTKLLEYAVEHMGANTLWALEKNTRAIRFYQRHGFHLTSERQLEDGTSEYLVRMQRGNSTWRTTRQ